MIHQLLKDRFNGTNHLIYMATSTHNIPSIRSLTPYYHEGSFYVITSKTSNKTSQIKDNPNVAICGYFFNASALAQIIGPLKQYPELSRKLKEYCRDWINLGKVNLESDDTCILEIKIQKGYIIDNEKRYEIDFS